MKAILLAAGFSSRMGELKQVMPIAGKPMVRQVAEALLAAGLELIVVIGHQGEQMKHALDGLHCEYILNAHPEVGMFSSVQLGCAAIKPLAPCLVSPSDCPGILPRTVQQIQAALERHPEQVIIPTFQGKKGHPVGLPVFLVEHLTALPPETPGLHSLWRNTPEIVLYLEVLDPAVLHDFDRPEDLKNAFEHYRVCNDR
jgi:molybdenum cofactor cytidylyltransferase